MNAISLLPRRIFAFVARDFRLYVSYRMQFFLRILSVLTVVTTFFFISKIFAFSNPEYAQWQDPLPTWLTGLAVLNYFMTGFSSLANSDQTGTNARYSGERDANSTQSSDDNSCQFRVAPSRNNVLFFLIPFLRKGLI